MIVTRKLYFKLELEQQVSIMLHTMTVECNGHLFALVWEIGIQKQKLHNNNCAGKSWGKLLQPCY